MITQQKEIHAQSVNQSKSKIERNGKSEVKRNVRVKLKEKQSKKNQNINISVKKLYVFINYKLF